MIEQKNTYQVVRRERFYAMQQVVSQSQRPNSRINNSGVSHSQIIVIFALFLFALAGVMSGFAIGAFVGHKSSNKTTYKKPEARQPVVAVQTQGPKPSPTLESITDAKIGCPILKTSNYSQVANNSSSYFLHARAMDKSFDKSSSCGQGKPLHFQNVYCKLWLTQDGNVGDNLPKDRLHSTSTLGQPFPKEQANALVFTEMPQLQLCNPAGGETVWNYQISSSVEPGKYYLVVLVDWSEGSKGDQGFLYNWRTLEITILKAK